MGSVVCVPWGSESGIGGAGLEGVVLRSGCSGSVRRGAWPVGRGFAPAVCAAPFFVRAVSWRRLKAGLAGLPARLLVGQPTAWLARLACPSGVPAGLLAGLHCCLAAWRAGCLAACWSACLPACWLAGRPPGLPAWPVRLACPLACWRAGLPTCQSTVRLPACLPACFLAGLPSCRPAGLLAWLPAFQAACSRSQHPVNIQSTSSQHPVNIQSTCAVTLMKLLTFSILRRSKLVLPSRHHLYIIEIMLIGSACAPFVPD